MHFIRFLAACYLVFNMDFGNVTKALESLPPIALHRPASGLPGVFAICCRNAENTAVKKARQHPSICACCRWTAGGGQGGQWRPCENIKLGTDEGWKLEVHSLD